MFTKVSLIVALVGFHFFAHAEEHGGGGAPAAAPPANAAPAQPGKGESEKMPQWVEIQNELSMISAKSNALRGNIRKLLEEKRELPENSHKLKEVTDELVKQHKDLKKLSNEYEQQRAILKYRYPERALQSGFQERIEVKSLQEMETELNLDDRLSRNLQKVRTQYNTKPRKVQTKKQTKPIEESESMILRK